MLITINDVLHKLAAAEKGRDIWIDLVTQKSINDDDQVILFPSEYNEWAYYGSVHIDDYLLQRNSNRAIILCFDKKIKEIVNLYSKKAEIVHFTRENAENLMSFFCLYFFTDNLIIMSPNEPTGRYFHNLVGLNGVTIEEITVMALYNIDYKK